MFLALTADRTFWKPGEITLLLGEWCCREGSTSQQEGGFAILPYHWNERAKLHHDHIYLTSVYERYLALLTPRLSAIHRLDVSCAFWRIVIGGRLAYFIDTLFESY